MKAKLLVVVLAIVFASLHCIDAYGKDSGDGYKEKYGEPYDYSKYLKKGKFDTAKFGNDIVKLKPKEQGPAFASLDPLGLG